MYIHTVQYIMMKDFVYFVRYNWDRPMEYGHLYHKSLIKQMEKYFKNKGVAQGHIQLCIVQYFKAVIRLTYPILTNSRKMIGRGETNCYKAHKCMSVRVHVQYHPGYLHN